MKKSLLFAAVAISAMFAAGAALAEDASAITYNLAVTNNYVWRGVSQTGGSAAVQGGLDYKKGNFYAGTWLSNVDFGNGSANTEMDLYMGLTPTVGDWSFDFGVIYYTYPDQAKGYDLNVGEFKTAVSHTLGKGTIGLAMYTPTETLEKPYYEVNASYPLTDKLSISGAVANYESAGYTTWNAGVTYALTSNLGLDLRYSEAEKQKSYIAATLKATF